MSRELTPKRGSELALWGLLLTILVAGFTRFPDLAAADWRGDEVELYERLQKRPTLGELAQAHFDEFGLNRQMPIPRMAAALVVVPLELEVTPFRVRLVFALAGVFTAIALWWLGLALGGSRYGPALATILGLLAASSPFNIYWSRTGHVYAFPMLFAALFYAATVQLTRRILQRGRADWKLWATVVFFAVCACYSHMSAWPAVLVAWAFPVGAWWSRGDHSLRAARPLLMVLGLWGLSLLPWVYAFLAPYFGIGKTHNVFSQENAGSYHEVWAMWRLPFVYTFGGGPWRSVLSLGLPVVALAHRKTRLPAVLIASTAAVIFFCLTVAQSIGFHSLRYYAPVWPLLLTLHGLGIAVLGDELRRRTSMDRRVLGALGATLLLIVSYVPVKALLELRGNPVEYSRIADTLDAHFAAGTPALVNGRFVVQHEMRPHLPEKVIPTFTVSDVGYRMWKDNRWRETAEDFLHRFTDAPLVQQGKNFYDVPEVGPWAFPEANFAHRIVLRNEPALLLERLLLAPIEDIYGGRTVTEISYNTSEDLIARAQADGKAGIVLWGEGWGYTKTPNFKDWRLLTDRAEAVVHNLTSEPLDTRILLDVRTLGGKKKIHINGSAVLTVPPPPEDTEDTRLLRIRQVFPPGRSVIVLEDPLWTWGQVPLLIASMELESNQVLETNVVEDSASGEDDAEAKPEEVEP